MILRKPYAFLIKNFKRIHFLVALLMGFLVYKSSVMLEYLNRYINEGWLNNSNIEISDYLTLNTFLIILLTIVLLSIILVLLVKKKKPTLFYIISIGMLVATVGVYLLVLSNLNIILIEVIDPRQIRVTRDFVMVVTVLQFINLIITFIRSTGFNIKKFDFEKDLKELDITAKDYEEIELTLKIDTNEIRRELRRRKRKFRYFILENLVPFIVVMVISLIVIGVYVFLSITVYNKVYLEGELFKTTEGNISVTDTYYTTVDYNGNEMESKNYGYLVIDFEVNNVNDEDIQLDTNNFVLFIDGEGYSPIKNKYVSMSDYGMGYLNQVIESGNKESFIVVFEIPKNLSLDDIILKYIDYYKTVKIYELETDYKQIAIEPSIVSLERENKSYQLGDKLEFSESYLENNFVTISEYDFNIRYDDNGLIRADNLGDYDKILLQLKMEYDGDISFAKLIETYGTIRYVRNDKEVEHSVPLINKTLNGSENMYIEVLEEVRDSKKIDFVFETREGTYTYTLKNE